jgi:hypothetical protein
LFICVLIEGGFCLRGEDEDVMGVDIVTRESSQWSPKFEPRPGELALFISVNLKIINQVGYVGDVNYNPTLE